jgi:glycosyltransferase involved in cell wall biosynthesis
VISFVVPAYNEEKYLAPTLAAIHAAARAVGEPYEIVVANDGSTDNTAQLAETGGARSPARATRERKRRKAIGWCSSMPTRK